MVRPWAKVSLSQYDKLYSLRKETGRPLSEIVRVALSRFLQKKEFTAGVYASYLPKGTKDKYKTVSAYFSQADWSLLQQISKNTGKCKTELIRQAVDEYLAK